MRSSVRLWTVMGLCAMGAVCPAQNLPSKWEDLTGPDFVKAIQKAGGVCVLPMGSLETSGPSQPLGTATYVGRVVVQEAVKQEYAVVFPDLIFARTNGEASLPGTVAYSERLQVEVLEETVHEMARNGCTKIVLANAQSGNAALISEFIAADLKTPHSYVVYTVFDGPPRMTPLTPQTEKLPVAMRASGPEVDGHGGEDRTSVLMAYYPDLAHPERAHDQPSTVHGAPSGLPQGISTEVAQLPSDYQGDSSHATVERGRAMVTYQAEQVAKALREIKADEKTPEVLKEYFEKEQHPTR